MEKSMEEKNTNTEAVLEKGYSEQSVIFKIEDEVYGIDIKKVDTVEQIMPTTRVPKTPYYLKGVINLRGEIIPVIDLRKKFNLQEVEYTEDTRIIIIKINDIKAGIIVDIVDEVINLKEEQINNSGNFTSELSEEYISSVANYDGNIITLLNAEKLIILDEEDIVDASKKIK